MFLLVGLKIRPDSGILITTAATSKIHGTISQGTGTILMFKDTRLLVGWQFIGSKWYYLNPSGAMKTGWLLLGNTWYYLNRSGVMLTGTHTINGAKHTFNSSGAMI